MLKTLGAPLSRGSSLSVVVPRAQLSALADAASPLALGVVCGCGETAHAVPVRVCV